MLSWIHLGAMKGPNVTVVEPETCGSNTCPPSFTGQFCETEIGTFHDFEYPIVYWQSLKCGVVCRANEMSGSSKTARELFLRRGSIYSDTKF